MRRLVPTFVLFTMGLAIPACSLGFIGSRAALVPARAVVGEAAVARAGAVTGAGARVGAGTTRGTMTGAAARATEPRIIAATRSGGLPALLDELALRRPVLDAAGRVVVDRTAVAVIDKAGTIRIASTGEIVGRIAGTRIVATRSAGSAGTEIGEIVGGRISPGMTVEVTAVRTGWYRVILRPPSSGGALAAAAALVTAQDESVEGVERVERVGPSTAAGPDLQAVVRAADAAGERRFRAGLRQGSSPGSDRPASHNHEIAELRASIEEYLQND